MRLGDEETAGASLGRLLRTTHQYLSHRDSGLSERLQMDADLTLEKTKKTVRQKEAVHKQHSQLHDQTGSKKDPNCLNLCCECYCMIPIFLSSLAGVAHSAPHCILSHGDSHASRVMAEEIHSFSKNACRGQLLRPRTSSYNGSLSLKRTLSPGAGSNVLYPKQSVELYSGYWAHTRRYCPDTQERRELDRSKWTQIQLACYEKEVGSARQTRKQ